MEEGLRKGRGEAERTQNEEEGNGGGRLKVDRMRRRERERGSTNRRGVGGIKDQRNNEPLERTQLIN